jgi:hypothetical protein
MTAKHELMLQQLLRNSCVKRQLLSSSSKNYALNNKQQWTFEAVFYAVRAEAA